MVIPYLKTLNERLITLGPAPKSELIWYAYKSGEVHEFSERCFAAACSDMVDFKILNNDEIEEWKQARDKIETELYKEWYQSLRDEYSDLTVEIFELLFLAASDEIKQDIFGIDEIAKKMKLYSHLAEHILAANKSIQSENDKLVKVCRKFIDDNNICSPEIIYQSDNVITNAYEFIHEVCEVVCYKPYDDEDDE